MILSRPIVPQTIPLAQCVASSVQKAIDLTMMKLSVTKMEHGADLRQSANKLPRNLYCQNATKSTAAFCH